MSSDLLHSFYARTRTSLLVRGLIALALGLFIVFRPLESAAVFALVIAFWALITGIGQIVEGIELRKVLPHWWLLLIGGVISVGFGVAALYFYPVLSLTFAVLWTAYWLLLSGVIGIAVALQERRLHSAWGWTLAFGILSLLAGLYAIAAPSLTLVAIMGLLAGFAIIGGILLLIAFFRLGTMKAKLSAPAAQTP